MMTSMDDRSLAEIADGLYALPLDDFIAARTAAAKEAAGSDKELAAAVRALPKPSVAAWAVNMLARQEPGVVEELADVGNRMQAAQSALDAAALRGLARERRTLLSAAADTARKVADEHGRAISGTMAGDVEETLRALTADPGAAVAVRSGRLLKTLTADGVNAVDVEGSVAVPSVLPEPDMRPAPAEREPSRTRPQERPTPAPAAGRPAASPQEAATPSQPTKPRLQAVRQVPRPPSPSALEKARAALAEAQAAEEEAAARAAELQSEAEETRNRVAALQEETAALRKRLKAAEEELERSRRGLGNTSAEAKQAARAADKAARTALLAQERVLRLGNTRS